MVVIASALIQWDAMVKILLIGIVAGAGLVTVFSFGLVALSASGYIEPADGSATKKNVLALLVSGLCFLTVIGGALFGIWEIFNKG